MALKIAKQNCNEKEDFGYQKNKVLLAVFTLVLLLYGVPYKQTCRHESNTINEVKLQQALRQGIVKVGVCICKRIG